MDDGVRHDEGIQRTIALGGRREPRVIDGDRHLRRLHTPFELKLIAWMPEVLEAQRARKRGDPTPSFEHRAEPVPVLALPGDERRVAACSMHSNAVAVTIAEEPIMPDRDERGIDNSWPNCCDVDHDPSMECPDAAEADLVEPEEPGRLEEDDLEPDPDPAADLSTVPTAELESRVVEIVQRAMADRRIEVPTESVGGQKAPTAGRLVAIVNELLGYGVKVRGHHRGKRIAKALLSACDALEDVARVLALEESGHRVRASESALESPDPDTLAADLETDPNAQA